MRNRRDRDDEPTPGRRLVISAMAPEGHGKSQFWMTAPKPIVACSVDPNTEDVVEKYFGQRSRDIDPSVLALTHIPFPLVGFEANEDQVKDEARDSWDRLVDVLRPIIRREADPMPKTVALDTGTELNELNILAEFGRTDKISPQVRRIKMGNVNAQFKGLFRGLERAGVHVVVTHRCKEHWATEERRTRNGLEEVDVVVPGVYDRIGFKQMGNIINTEILMLFDPTRSEKLAAKFGLRVTRCMIRPALIGTEWWGRERVGDQRIHRASFPYLATQLYPNTSIEEWS